MSRSRWGKPSRKSTLIVLFVIAIVALIMPQSIAGRFISLVQILVPFQHAASSATDVVVGEEGANTSDVSGEEYEAMKREKLALEHRLASMSLHVENLQRDVGILTATRSWDVEGQRIGSRGRLIPAGVVTPDLLSWRSSRLINAGSLQGVKNGAPVASRYFTIDRGDESGVQGGMAILRGETFIGIVEQTGTHTARIKLLSDISVEMKVRIGRFVDDTFTLIGDYYWLVGRGQGKMEIKDVPRRDVENGGIVIGDVVLSDPTNGALPSAMTIGRVTDVRLDRDQPLFTILKVQSEIDESWLQRVYVFDPEGLETRD